MIHSYCKECDNGTFEYGRITINSVVPLKVLKQKVVETYSEYLHFFVGRNPKIEENLAPLYISF